MRITQGAFSFLPDLTDEQIRAQIEYCLRNGWAVSVEFTDDPHPRNTFWEMWGMPMFDLKDAAGVMREVEACRDAYPDHYIKVNAFDSQSGWEALRLSIHRQPAEIRAGFRARPSGNEGRSIRYTTRSYAARKPEGERYVERAGAGKMHHAGSATSHARHRRALSRV